VTTQTRERENNCGQQRASFFVVKVSHGRYKALQMSVEAGQRSTGSFKLNGETQMKIRNISLAALCLLTLSQVAQAGCVIHYNRTACPGQETVSYSKCNGTKECDKEDTSATSVKACEQATAAACVNTRLTITKSKIVTGKFNGTALRGGSNFCASNRPDFNQCAK
jgi:uncharacterized protein (UPF0179 family)